MWNRRLFFFIFVFFWRHCVAFDTSEYGISGEHPRCLDGNATVPLPKLTSDVRLDPVLISQKTWLTHCFISQIVRIILEELLGQRTVWVDTTQRTGSKVYEDVACRSQGSDCAEPEWQSDVDLENWFVHPTSDKHRQYVYTDATVMAFALGFSGMSGIYFAPHDAPQNAWDSWDYYKRHLDDDVLAKFPQAGTVDVLDVFDGNAEVPEYCGEAWNNQFSLSTGQEWCVEGRYVPPLCRSDFTACRELYHANKAWDQGRVEQMITNNNLKYVVSYITPKFVDVLRERTKTKPVIYYYYEPDPLNAVLKGQRIQFPKTTSGCLTSDTFTPDGPVSCDFAETVIYKVMASQLKSSNSIALSVMQKFRSSQAEVDWMIARHKDADPSGQDCFNVSCEFVKENMQMIMSLMPACASDEQWLGDELRCVRKCDSDRVGQDCRRCPPGSVPNEQQTDCKPCQQGHFADQTSEVVQCQFCEPGTFQDEIGQTECKQCPLGTATKFPGSTGCSACGTEGGVVFYGPRMGLSDCIPCPMGAECPEDENGTRVRHQALPGWYLAPSTVSAGSDLDNVDGRLYKCPNSDPDFGNACLGGNACIVVAGEVSMEGMFCGTCRPGFQPNIEGGICLKCTEADVVLATYIALGVLIVVITVALQVIFHVTMDFSQPMDVYVIILKQFFNYAQLLSVVASMNDLRLFDFSQMMVWAKSLVSPPSVTTFSLDCLYLFGNERPTQYDRVIRAFLEPFLFLGLSNLGYFMAAKFRQLRYRIPIDWSQCVPVSIICLFVIHPRLNQTFCRTFRCIVADEARLVSDLSVRCDSDEHGLWQSIAASGVVLYSLGIPLMFFVVLFRARRFLLHVRYKSLFGFLYNGFEPHFYYFEVVFMLRKVLFQVVAVLPTMYNSTQDEGQSLAHLISLSIVSCWFLCLHVTYHPFDDRGNCILDKVETSMLRAITATVVLNLLSKGTDRTSRFREESARRARDTFFFIIMFLLHLYFLAVVVYGLFRGPLHRLFVRLEKTPFAIILKTAGWQREGHLMYEGDRLDVSDLSDRDRDLLSQTLGDLIRHRMGGQPKLQFTDIADSVAYCCTEGRLMRERIAAKQEKSNPKALATSAPSSASVAEGLRRQTSENFIALTEAQAAEGAERRSSKQTSVALTATKSLLDAAYELVFGVVEVPAPDEYRDPTNVKDTEGQKFSVGELQVSLMRMTTGEKLEDCVRASLSTSAPTPNTEDQAAMASSVGVDVCGSLEAKLAAWRDAGVDSSGSPEAAAETFVPCGSPADDPMQDDFCDVTLFAVPDGPTVLKVRPTSVGIVGASEYAGGKRIAEFIE